MNSEQIRKLNENLDNHIFMLYNDKHIDMVQVGDSWIKAHFKKNNATTLITYKSLNYISPDIDVDEVKKMITDEVKSEVFFKLSDWSDSANTILRSGLESVIENLKELTKIDRLIGQASLYQHILTKSLDSIGNPLEGAMRFETKTGVVHVYDIGYKTSEMKHIWTNCIKPIVEFGQVLNVGSKLVSKNAVRAKNISELDNMYAVIDNVEQFVSDIPDTDDNKMVNESENIVESKQSCAERRLKLFDAAKHLGASIEDNGKWKAAVCFKYEQCHVFGRLKPKVIPGTNEIDPAVNLEDWEGITPENKAKRDDWQLPWVKDGITDGHGHSFDHLSGESGQPKKSFGCETAWCNCGVLNGDGTWIPRDKTNMYFEYYNNGGKTPYIILMNTHTGALYQYVKIHRGDSSIVNFANEDDKVDGGHVGNPPDSVQMKFFEDFAAADEDFRDLIEVMNDRYFDK